MIWSLFCLLAVLQYALGDNAPRVVTTTFDVPLASSSEDFVYHNVGDIPRPLYRLALLQDIKEVTLSLTTGKWRDIALQPRNSSYHVMPHGALLTVTYDHKAPESFDAVQSILSGLFCIGTAGAETWQATDEKSLAQKTLYLDRTGLCTENLASLHKFIPHHLPKQANGETPAWPLDRRYQGIQLAMTRHAHGVQYVFQSGFSDADHQEERDTCLDLAYTIEEQSWTEGTLVVTASHRCDSTQKERIALPISDTLKPYLHQATFPSLDPSQCRMDVTGMVDRTITLKIEASGKNAFCQFRLPVQKRFRTWTQFRPDAERGINSMPIKRLDVFPDAFLLDTPMIILPTPDFSMPYNVLSMTSTVITLFFGNMVNGLMRKHLVLRTTS